MKKIIIILTLAAALGGGSWYYYVTSVHYAYAQARTSCLNSDLKSFAKIGVIFDGEKLREFTESEIEAMSEAFKRSGQSTECPFKDRLDKKITRSKLSSDVLKRYGTDAGWNYHFEGESEKYDMKFVKFQGKWRVLMADANLTNLSPAVTTPPPAGVPPKPNDEQVEINNPTPPPTAPTAPPANPNYSY